MAYKVSIEDAVEDEPSRFLAYAIQQNPNIKDLGDLREALKIAFDTATGHNAITEQALLNLWETKECKNLVAGNTTSEEYEKLYGDGKLIRREVINNKIITIREKKIVVKSHNWRGQSVRGYDKGYRRWTNAEVKFLQVRKAKRISPVQTIADFNKHFKEKRSSSSISTKLFRI